jgi:Fic family protein
VGWDLAARLAAATHALGELAGIARNLPDPDLLIRPFLRREAVLSSRIEGTQASLSDVFLYEAAPKHPPPGREPPGDVREVVNYVHALRYGLSRLDEMPLSLRLFRELHRRLMEGVRGPQPTPGEFRRSQNWIGPPGCTLEDATFVPPPVPQMHEGLSQLERYLYQPPALPPLVRIALVHYQFEAIHPFLDGNGRVGRLLISLLLCREGLLHEPLLYLSAFFERCRDDYYRLLLDVSRHGAWNDWIGFFLTGIEEQSRDAIWRIGELLALWQRYRSELATVRSSVLLLDLVDRLFENPAITLPEAARHLKVTHRAAKLNVDKLVRAGILTEITGRIRHKLYVALGILERLEASRAVS